MVLAYSGIVDAPNRDAYVQVLFESLYNTSSLYVGPEDGSMNHSFVCFTGVEIAKGAISSGYLTLNLISSTNTRLTDGLVITANNTISPTSPSNFAQYAAISGNHTSANTTVYLGSGISQNWVLNPVIIDISPCLIEVNNHSDWDATPKNVLLFMKDKAGWIGGALRFEDFDNLNNNGPLLTIYTSDGGGGGGGGSSSSSASTQFLVGCTHKSFSIINAFTLD